MAHCSTRMCDMHQRAGVLTISAASRNVLLCGSAHVQWKLVAFKQGVQMVKVRAKLLGGVYKSNTEFEFRQAATDEARDLNHAKHIRLKGTYSAFLSLLTYK